MNSEIVFALDSMPLNRNIHWPADYDARFIGEAVLRTMFAETADGALRPGSALAAERLGAGQRWRVTLDATATWSDGRPLTVEHALASVRTILDRPRSALARLLYADAPEEPAVRRGTDTVEYRFARPVSYLPSLLTLPQFAPSRAADEDGPANAPAPVLGPYEISGHTPDEIRMHLRDDVDDGGHGRRHPRRLRFRVYGSARQALDALARGEVDVSPITSFTAADVAACEGRSGFVSRGISLFGSLEFGARCGLADRPDLRRTLGLALDRERIAERCPGLVIPFLHQTAPWSAPTAPLSPAVPTRQETEALRRALGTAFDIPYADFAPNGTVVQAVCDQLRDLFGITAEPRPLSYRAYVRTAVSQDHSLLYTLTTADFPHPAALLAPWRSDGAAARRAGLADEVLDGLLDAASEETGPAAQSACWEAADRRLTDLMPRIPLLQVRAHCLRSPRLTGTELNSGGLLDFGRLVLHPDAGTPHVSPGPERFEEAPV